MSIHPFIEAVRKYVSLSEKEGAMINNYLTYSEVPEGFKLVDLDDYTDKFYFLQKGCARLYYIKESGDEVTGFFFTEHMFLGSLESVLSGKPSKQVLETLEPSELWGLQYDKLLHLFDRIPQLNIFFRKLLAERFINAQQVVASFILLNPEERYIRMLKQNPGILNRVPQHKLASYLGITPVSLSRIRKRILKNDLLT